MKKSRWRKVFSLLVIGLTIAMVCVLAFSNQELYSVGEVLMTLEPVYLIGCLLGFIGYAAFDGVGLFAFLRRQGYKIRLSSSIHLAFTGFYYANITPGSSGGQPMQVYLMSKRNIPVGVATSALSVRFLSNQLMMVVLAAGMWMLHSGFVQQQLGRVTGLIILGLVINGAAVPLILLVACCRNWVHRAAGWVVHLLARWHIVKQEEATMERLNTVLETYHASIRLALSQPGQVLLQLLFSTLELVSLISVTLWVYRAFGQTAATAGEVMTVALLLFISASYTPLPGASGFQEGGFLLYYRGLFQGGSLRLALLVWRLFTYYLFLLVGVADTVITAIRRRRHPESILLDTPGKPLAEVAEEEL